VQATTIDGKSLSYVLMLPDGFDSAAGYPLVVLLHGFGASMEDLAGLAPAIDASGYAYAFPNGPYTVELGPGMYGFSWALGRPGVIAPSADGPSIEDQLDGFMDDLLRETGAERGRIVLGGFSQGGGLTLRYGLPRPETFTGLAVLSGFFRDADEMREKLPKERRQPVFVAHGTRDPVVVPSAGRGTKAFLDEMGYPNEYHEYEMAHQITPAEIRDLTAWLHATLPPRDKA